MYLKKPKTSEYPAEVRTCLKKVVRCVNAMRIPQGLDTDTDTLPEDASLAACERVCWDALDVLDRHLASATPAKTPPTHRSLARLVCATRCILCHVFAWQAARCADAPPARTAALATTHAAKRGRLAVLLARHRIDPTRVDGIATLSLPSDRHATLRRAVHVLDPRRPLLPPPAPAPFPDDETLARLIDRGLTHKLVDQCFTLTHAHQLDTTFCQVTASVARLCRGRLEHQRKSFRRR